MPAKSPLYMGQSPAFPADAARSTAATSSAQETFPNGDCPRERRFGKCRKGTVPCGDCPRNRNAMAFIIASPRANAGSTALGTNLKTYLLTALAMIAFAANSLLSRAALGADVIDPASFASIRILTGAVLLSLWLGEDEPAERTNEWIAPGALFVYLMFFSYAYVSLDAATGALILFACVQLSMVVYALVKGERFAALAWIGLGAAIGGFVYLLSPGLSAPPLVGAALMATAGVAWGVYTLRGRLGGDALKANRRNFALATAPALAVSLALADHAYLTWTGVALALVSGTLASALGYVVWYRALEHLNTVSAATVQLSVPLLAALGGVALLAESFSVRLGIASFAILGGIALVIRHSARAAD